MPVTTTVVLGGGSERPRCACLLCGRDVPYDFTKAFTARRIPAELAAALELTGAEGAVQVMERQRLGRTRTRAWRGEERMRTGGVPK